MLLISGLRERYGLVRADFDHYTETLRRQWEAEWQRAQELEQRDSWTVTTVNSLERFAVVYDRMIANRSWPDLIQQLLRFVPTEAETNPMSAPRYLERQSISDHFKAPVSELADRASDFGQVLFADAQNLHVLDIIELRGKDESRAFLGRVLDKARSLPEFSSGPIPQLEVDGLFKRHRILRCSEAVKAGLLSHYGHLWGDNDAFSEVSDAEVIDITALTFGFPRSLLHVLAHAGSVAESD